MKFLLDVNVLLAAIWSNHSRHASAFQWLEGKAVVLCPLAELGFLRISTNAKAINAPMATARTLLEKFVRSRHAERIADDLAPLESHPKSSGEVMDSYLAELAARHGLKLATFDAGITHKAAEIVS